MNQAIRTEKLTKRYQRHLAVDSLDLEVYRGEIFGFLGPNGAGKTTTIGMLLGLIAPTSGRAEVLGHSIAHSPGEALHRVGAMIETPAFYPYLSGRDNLRALAMAGGLPATRADEVLAIAGLAERGRDRFRSYSLGMRQRLGIAAALLNSPDLIMLDEPTNGLDPAGQQEIRALIKSLAADGRTILLCSHVLHDVEQVCDRVAILKDGRLRAMGRVADLLRRGHGLLVRVAGDLGQAAGHLRALPWVESVTIEGDAMLVSAPVERAAEVTLLLASHAIGVSEIRPDHDRLEDVFLEITRQ